MIELEKKKMISILNKITVVMFGDFDYWTRFETFHKPYTALINKLFLFYLIILLLVKCEFSCEKSELNRALNVIHGKIWATENQYGHIWI
jgi:hypothetical protein